MKATRFVGDARCPVTRKATMTVLVTLTLLPAAVAEGEESGPPEDPAVPWVIDGAKLTSVLEAEVELVPPREAAERILEIAISVCPEEAKPACDELRESWHCIKDEPHVATCLKPRLTLGFTTAANTFMFDTSHGVKIMLPGVGAEFRYSFPEPSAQPTTAIGLGAYYVITTS
jgi:hypothetical protein